jgi:multiple sugar transport system substrate-binding protein
MSAPWRLIGNRQKLGLALLACPFLLLLGGCPDADSRRTTPLEGMLPENIELSVLVVDDPALAAAIEQVEGEWNALTGSSFRIDPISQEQLEAAQTLQADAVIAASCQVGDVQAKAQIVPVPASLVKGDQGSWSELFSLLRVRETVWGNEVVGVPFGSPVLVVYYRADLLEKLGRRPPRTWAEYSQLAELLSDRSLLGQTASAADTAWHGAVEPLGPGWAGLVLLARAAPYVSHRENYSTMFRIDSMEPLIDGPPFVRALEELVAAAASGPSEQLTYDPPAVRNAFWQGRCGLALTWPSAAREPSPSADSPDAEASPAGRAAPPGDRGVSIGLADLPGSTDAYDVAEKLWEPRREDGEEPYVPLLGTAGRLGLVLKSSPAPDAAFRLLFWLSDEQSTRVCPASPATTLFRSPHLDSPENWVEQPMPPHAAAQYARMTQATLCRPQWLFALRIPGRRKYLAALDAAVHRAVRGEQTPQQALADAAHAWRKITDQLGLDSQRQAYWISLGLE